ncbi:hypothetical protein Vafri_5873 [Volvox africanus]|nr:hypothetical protein Vafri_5873 [Volvox africanus]
MIIIYEVVPALACFKFMHTNTLKPLEQASTIFCDLRPFVLFPYAVAWLWLITLSKKGATRLARRNTSHQPGSEAEMWTKPEFIRDSYQGADKLIGKVAFITGGDSGIGRSVAVHCAREGERSTTQIM